MPTDDVGAAPAVARSGSALPDRPRRPPRRLPRAVAARAARGGRCSRPASLGNGLSARAERLRRAEPSRLRERRRPSIAFNLADIWAIAGIALARLGPRRLARRNRQLFPEQRAARRRGRPARGGRQHRLLIECGSPGSAAAAPPSVHLPSEDGDHGSRLFAAALPTLGDLVPHDGRPSAGGARGSSRATIAARPEIWQPLSAMDASQRRYELIYEDERMDAWVLSWMPGQGTGFHDHYISSVGLAVALGRDPRGSDALRPARARAASRAGRLALAATPATSTGCSTGRASPP